MNWKEWYRKYRAEFGCKNPHLTCWCGVCCAMECAWEDAMQAAKQAIDTKRSKALCQQDEEGPKRVAN